MTTETSAVPPTGAPPTGPGADPLADTDLALAPPPEGLVGLGLAEVYFLLSLHDTPTTQTSRRFLLLDPDFATSAVLLCGASSLLARGLLSTGGDGTTMVTRSSAALFEVVTGQTVRWTRIGLIGPDTEPLAAFFLQTPVLCGMVQTDTLATWWTRFGDADDDTGAILAALVTQRLESDPGSAVVVDTMLADGARHNLLVRQSSSGYTAHRDAGPAGVGGDPVALPPGGLAELFRDLVPVTA